MSKLIENACLLMEKKLNFHFLNSLFSGIAFLAYMRVSSEGQRISLVQTATSVIQAMDSADALHAVQPMKDSSFFIYSS